MTLKPLALSFLLLSPLGGCGWLNPQEGAAHLGTWSVIVDRLDKDELAFHVENHEGGRPDERNHGMVCLWAMEWDSSLKPYPGYEGWCRLGVTSEQVRLSLKGKQGKANLRVFATDRLSKPEEGFQDHWYREVAHVHIEVK